LEKRNILLTHTVEQKGQFYFDSMHMVP